MRRLSPLLIGMLCFGYAFFYVPILSMIFYSFNKSRLATVWGGFSTQWYGKLLRNQQVLDAAFLSVGIALVSATFATILGTMAGMALARFRRFPGRTAVFRSGDLAADHAGSDHRHLARPAVHQSEFHLRARGATTITIAHITFSMSYVATIVQSRLASMDRSVEEAAMDLGFEAVPGAVRCDAADHRAGHRLGMAARLHAVAGRRGDHQLHQRPRIDDAADLHFQQGAARRDARHECARHHHHHGGRRRRGAGRPVMYRAEQRREQDVQLAAAASN